MHLFRKLIYYYLHFQVYSDENRTPFPDDLSELTDVVAQYLGYTDFKAEAAIVNYYHMDSTLSAHTDHSEVNLEAPLFSFRYVVQTNTQFLTSFSLNKTKIQKYSHLQSELHCMEEFLQVILPFCEERIGVPDINAKVDGTSLVPLMHNAMTWLQLIFRL